MPAPAHLLPILEALGDGGTVPLAEKVHVLIEAAVQGREALPYSIDREILPGHTYVITVPDGQDTEQDLNRISKTLHTKTGAEFLVLAPGTTLFEVTQDDTATLLAQVQRLTEELRLAGEHIKNLTDSPESDDRTSTDDLLSALVDTREHFRSAIEKIDQLSIRRDEALDLLDRWEADGQGDVVSATAVRATLDPPPAEDPIGTSSLADALATRDAALRAAAERSAKDAHTIQAANQGIADAMKQAEPAQSTVPAKTVRAWCRETGVDCPPRGSIPPAVQAAYNAAHQPTLAAEDSPDGDDWIDDITSPEAGTEGASE